MKLSLFGRFALALFASLTLGLGMTGCGSYNVAFLWVVGQQYNQIGAFRMDNYTGNLTETPGQPFPSGGSNPVSILVRTGGRYVYVLNQGTLPSSCSTAATCTEHYSGGNVSVFSVGGNGVLVFQQSYVTQGFDSQWMQFDNTNGYLYVLDQYSPSGDGNGAITAYSINPSNGRLTLVQNTQSIANNQPALTYFEVGDASTSVPAPFMAKTAGTCLFVANRSNLIVPFVFANGQLQTSAANKVIQISNTSSSVTPQISSIGGNSGSLTVTDTANNAVALYSVTGGCGLTIEGSGWEDLGQFGTVNPTYAIIDSTNQYVYVLNQTNDNTTVTHPYSTLLGFHINTGAGQNELEPLSDSPYGVGSNPVCMVEDPTNQYIFTSNHNDGTITGNVFNSSDGMLTPLTRGSTFTTVGEPECMVMSGSVD